MKGSTDSSSLRERLLADPQLFVQKLDLKARTALLIRMSATDYRDASFLDDRILGPATRGGWVQMDALSEALEGAAPARPLHFIFHMGHVGSTLLSRLVEQCHGVLALREPLTLRILAALQDAAVKPENLATLDRLLREQIVLWSRGWPETSAVVVKATSTAARLAPRLLTLAPRARCIYMSLRLEPYLATLLSGENSHIDLSGHAKERARRLRTFTGADVAASLPTMSLGELAAMAWIVEKMTESAMVTSVGERALAIDFDMMLTNVEDTLGLALKQLDIAGDVHAIASGPVMQSYSKAPDLAYTTHDRTNILNDARRAHANEIQAGMRWLERLAHDCPGAAPFLDR